MLVAIVAPLILSHSVATAQSRAMPNLEPVSFENVRLTDQFWSPRLETLREHTLPHQFEMLKKHHYERNFERAIAGEAEGFSGFVFHDSDLYKVLEAACLSLATRRDPKIEVEVDMLIALVGRAQMPDGYINTHFQIGKLDQRWTNLRDLHELYCAGHLIEASVAHFLATGKRPLLDIAVRFADLIDSRFGADKLEGYPGHPELELALVKLYRATGERKYFDLARHFVLVRGSKFFAREHKTPLERYDGTYWQDRVPIKEWDVIEGHAVRATYLLSAITDIVREEFDPELEAMLQRVWRSAALRRTYVTGGIGSSGSNEGFTTDYDLPNATAYQETCASIAMAMWNHRMGLFYGDAKYFDVAETALYNAALSGISLEGTHFFYANPLESNGHHRRPDWYSCACCPPNIARTLAQIGGYAYAVSEDGVWVNLYVDSGVNVAIGGTDLRLRCKTRYPWDGDVEIRVEMPKAMKFALRLRVPGWCREYAVRVNGISESEPSSQNGYITIEREWKPGDVVELKIQMAVRQIESHPRVVDNVGKLAIARGPIIYCLEGVDHEQHLSQISILPEVGFETAWTDDVGGFVEVRTMGFVRQHDWGGGLYRERDNLSKVSVRAIPYYAWANREQCDMLVWIPTSPPPALVGGPEFRAQVSVSFHSDWSNPIGINDGKTPKNSADHSGELCHFWPHKGGTEWVQYTWKTPVSVRGSRVYWFDDTGKGECRPPKSWRIEYWQEGVWKPVAGAEYEIALDKWCAVSFERIETTAMRLVADQQDAWAVGIHEWQIVPVEED